MARDVAEELQLLVVEPGATPFQKRTPRVKETQGDGKCFIVNGTVDGYGAVGLQTCSFSVRINNRGTSLGTFLATCWVGWDMVL